MVPDVEKIVGNYLRADAGVAAAAPGVRIVGKTPGDIDRPWVRVTQINTVKAGRSSRDVLNGHVLQLDCYAGRDGGQPEANLLARTVRAALDVIPAQHDDAVITGTRPGGMSRIPDVDIDPPRDRVIVTVTVYAHPA